MIKRKGLRRPQCKNPQRSALLWSSHPTSPACPWKAPLPGPRGSSGKMNRALNSKMNQNDTKSMWIQVIQKYCAPRRQWFKKKKYIYIYIYKWPKWLCLICMKVVMVVANKSRNEAKGTTNVSLIPLLTQTTPRTQEPLMQGATSTTNNDKNTIAQLCSRAVWFPRTRMRWSSLTTKKDWSACNLMTGLWCCSGGEATCTQVPSSALTWLPSMSFVAGDRISSPSAVRTWK